MEKRRDETDEEKRARRLAKKAAKREKEVAQLAGYSNESNPWNDPNLADAFVWGKNDKSGSVASADAMRRRRAEQLEELEKVKKAREQREIDREAWEEEKRLLEREREQMAFVENEKREEQFQLKQSHLRAHIRVNEGRAKPIDVLSEGLMLLHPEDLPEGEDESSLVDVRVGNPFQLFDGPNQRELRDLHAELCRRAQLDVPNASFWAAMRRLCEACEEEREGKGNAGAADSMAVKEEVAQMLAGQSATELDELEAQIQAQLQEEDAGDADYWRAISRELGLARARAIVQESFEQMKAAKERIQQRVGSSTGGGGGGGASASTGGVEAAASGGGGGGGADQSGRYSPELFDEDEDGEDAGAAMGEGVAPTSNAAAAASSSSQSGRYSPPLLAAVGDLVIVDEEEDRKQLMAERARIRSRSGAAATNAGQSTEAGSSSTAEAAPADAAGSALAEAEARRGMEAGEAKFSFEVPLEKKVTWWHDRYRPRKPKYFNRVHTGYEWNKYNQTHYDHDNPPPKMVQGYKFAVFYPDLIDRTQTPTYQLLPDPSGEKDTCLIKFKGGPPYEDVAFKIVNREWEMSHKRGFKCRFERGILQLHFGFKRFRYRR